MEQSLRVVRLSKLSICPEQCLEKVGYLIRAPRKFRIFPRNFFAVSMLMSFHIPGGASGFLGNLPSNYVQHGLFVPTTVISSSTQDVQNVICQNMTSKTIYFKRGSPIALLTLVKTYCPPVLNLGLQEFLT